MTADELLEFHKKLFKRQVKHKMIFKEDLKTTNKQFRQCNGGAFQ